MAVEHIHVEVESTNICNTVCLHCPHDAISRPFGKMDWETYVELMDQLMARTPHFSVEYAGMGEPLLNPLTYRFIEYLNGKGYTSLTTNASALTADNVDRLIGAGLNRLTISINGEDKAIYELMMGGLDFERTMKNIRNAVESCNGSSLELAANVSVTRQTQAHLAAIQTHIQNMGIQRIHFAKCHHRGGFLKGNLVCTTPPPPTQTKRCDIFTNTLFVAWNGDFLSCCHDLAGGTVLGNLRQSTLDAILEKKHSIAAAGVNFSICQGCNDLFRFINDQTAFGRDYAGWVYDLYTDSQPDESSLNALSTWMYDIYAQEGQEKKLVVALAARLETQEAHLCQLEESRAQEAARLQAEVQTLQAQLQARQAETEAIQAKVQSLQTDVHNILNSRSWRLIKHFQDLRHLFIPLGSRREKLLYKILGRV